MLNQIHLKIACRRLPPQHIAHILNPNSPDKTANEAGFTSFFFAPPCSHFGTTEMLPHSAVSKHLLSANKVYPLRFFDSSPSTTCVR